MPNPKITLCLILILTLQSLGIFVTSDALSANKPSADQDAPQFIQSILNNKQSSLLHKSDFSEEYAVLATLYSPNSTTPLWFINDRVTPSALALLNVLNQAATYGLNTADYEANSLTAHLMDLSRPGKSITAQQQAALDIAISTVAVRFIRHLHYGRIDPRQVGFNLPITRNQELDVASTLINLSKSHDLYTDIEKLEPQFTHYRLLKSALTRYQTLAEHPEWVQLRKPTSTSIKQGDSYSDVPALRRLLLAEQDLTASATETNNHTELDDTRFDPLLVQALKNYQFRHGLTADGILGPQTFKALTTPFSKRVQQIELTLERWRWLPPLQSPMIVVNIPQFKLFAFKSTDDTEANLLRMEVIVGQAFEHTQTPVFLGEMKYMVFRPYWDVPLSITQRELLPNIRRNPNYLEQHHFELVKGQSDQSPVVPATLENINQLATGKIRIRQRPGEDNALGNIKFMLPNKYNVYLHSTPAQQLFNESRRAFSHGCIRVSNTLALAEYVLSNAAEPWHQENITAALQGEANQRVNLIKPIPVMIVYGTVMPLESGVVQFFEDIYGHDAKLAALL